MDVVIRFVPKTKSDAPRREFFGTARSSGISSLAPARRNASGGMRRLSGIGINAQTTSRDRLEAELPIQQAIENFGVEFTERDVEEKASSISLRKSFVVPTKELRVPPELEDVIDFAYVPTPVEFYSTSYLAPVENLHYHNLDTVRLALNASACHRLGWTGAGVRVAMADTGFFVHPWFLRNRFSLVPTPSPGSGEPTDDQSGHGTGESANIFAIAPDCTVFGVKHGTSTISTLEACLDQNPNIMTHSWGWSVDHQSKQQLRQNDPNFYNELVDIETVLLEAIAGGISVFFSAGNGHLAFPACMNEVISVGGVSIMQDSSLEASNYASSFRSKLYPGRKVPDFCGIVGQSAQAPMPGHIMLPVPKNCDLDGENFSSGRTGLGWGIFSGTSAASPQAAGIAALLKGIGKSIQPETVRSILAQTSVDVTAGRSGLGDRATSGPDDATGAGFLDALAACQHSSSVS